MIMHAELRYFQTARAVYWALRAPWLHAAERFCSDGRVIRAGWNARNGPLITIEGPNDIEAIFRHLCLGRAPEGAGFTFSQVATMAELSRWADTQPESRNDHL